MQKKLHRLLLTLQALPYAPRKITTTDIHKFLSAAGHDVTLRSVQRDLESLSSSFAISSDNAKPAGWYWSKDATVMGVPALDPHSALALQLAKKHLERILPVATMNHLSPQFRLAAETLDAHGNGLRNWQNKVRIIPRGVTLTTPKVDAAVQSVIYESLLKERKVALIYRPRMENPKSYEVNPLGLIVRDQVTYLICSYEDKLRQFLMHRIVSAEILDTPSTFPDGFNLDNYILTGGMTYATGHSIPLCFALHEYAARQLRDCPLSSDQHITEPDEGEEYVTIKATVQDSRELRWWLLSFGDEAEVIEPPELRAWFKENAEIMASYYADDTEP
jgi:predicted DNA-binding transcriptional regulator YafY